eukprot:TRINITY_DN4799_c0_g1_i1.p1 TRINITY_DN4799_c0_g1~~TRINITY_DN4799_c0_g1_i1.p1  ORF type:complete len:315 (-),score=72.37 TRINITY_DN4799_c0_g1_i1:222-1109(-)
MYILFLFFVGLLGWLVYQSKGTKSDVEPPSVRRKKRQQHAAFIRDKYQSLEEVQAGLRASGLESSNLIIAIDYSKSNEYSGAKTYNGNCLHMLESDDGTPVSNPYQEVISIIGRTLQAFDEDQRIPVYYFGDQKSTNKRVICFKDGEVPCNGFQEVLERYNDVTPHIHLASPTSFAPVIKKAVQIVKRSQAYHILLIITDGEVNKVKETKEQIVEASNYPLSIVVVGVGDGPFDLMETFDDGLRRRQFDNFQFVDYNSVLEADKIDGSNPDIEFALRALMEIPEQYKILRKLKMV